MTDLREKTPLLATVLKRINPIHHVQYSLYLELHRPAIHCLLMPGILIVDDNPNIRYLLRVFVETKTEFQVCGEAGHGSEAIQKSKELHPALILLDLSMPVLGGAEAASIIKKLMPDTKIVLFSMHFDDVPKTLAAKVGVDLTLSKMDGITRLGEHLKTLLTPAVSPDNSMDITPEVSRAAAIQKPV
jgi:DNA-binding NarL/FixJ family response regulator